MNVYPRKPLEAERIKDNGLWRHYVEWETPTGTLWALCTDAEFAANFYPAELLDALIAAVGALPFDDLNDFLFQSRQAKLALPIVELTAAFRAFREQVTA